MSKWLVQITKVANVGVHKMLRITCEIPQEWGSKFIETMGWPTEQVPISATLELSSATEDKAERETPSHEMAKLDKPLEQTPPAAGVHNPYSRRAGILAQNKEFQTWQKLPNSDYAAQFIRHNSEVPSRKDILPGTKAAELFDKLYSDFVVWRDGPRHGA